MRRTHRPLRPRPSVSAARALVVGLGLAVAACTDAPADDDPQSVGLDAAVGTGCVEGSGTCAGSAYSVCQGGQFVQVQVCAATAACVPGVGCAACSPGEVAVCEGSALFACGVDGARGEKITDCESGCANGQCVTDCAIGAELIYVVDVENTLLSFDPRTSAFARVGRLDCPAGPTWPRFGDGPATPFSMAVDRQAQAWVLFSSGEIFWVDTATANCRRSPFPPGSGGFELFGMAFVSDGADTQSETLHVVGGPVDAIERGRLGTVDARASDVTYVAMLPAHDYGAELTGNGNGELWAYWPGPNSSVARIDKFDAFVEQEWPLPALRGQPAGWAFAHWGGQYFVFISESDGAGGVSSRVLRFDPVTGRTVVAVEETGRRIVGAGVSTCAPVVSNF
jgi:hypothetical protein